MKTIVEIEIGTCYRRKVRGEVIKRYIGVNPISGGKCEYVDVWISDPDSPAIVTKPLQFVKFV